MVVGVLNVAIDVHSVHLSATGEAKTQVQERGYRVVYDIELILRYNCLGVFSANSDVQIVNEVMLEDINNILNAGDVPNLYAPEDLDAIMSACR